MSEPSPLAILLLSIVSFGILMYVLHFSINFLRHFKDETSKDFYQLCLGVVMVSLLIFMWLIHLIVKREADETAAEIVVICIGIWILIGVLMYHLQFSTDGENCKVTLTNEDIRILLVPIPFGGFETVQILNGQMLTRTERIEVEEPSESESSEESGESDSDLPQYSDLFPLPFPAYNGVKSGQQ